MAKKGKSEKAVVPAKAKVETLPSGKREVGRLVDEFDRMVEEMWHRPFPTLTAPFPSLFRSLRDDLFLRTPAVDVFENQEEVIVKAELPGLTKGDIQVNVTGSTVTLSGEKKKEEEVKDEDYTYQERKYGRFSRSVSLPCDVKADQAKATFRDGILEIRFPKTEEAKKRHHTIKIE